MKPTISTVILQRILPAYKVPISSSGNGYFIFVLGAVLLSLIASLVSPIATTPAYAAPSWPGQNHIVEEVYDNVSGHQHYYWLYACFRHADIDKVTPGEMNSWDFFERNTNAQALGAMYPGETASGSIQGTRDCQTQSLVKTAFGKLGFTDPRKAFCSLDGAQYRDDHDGGYADCIAGVGGHDWDNNESTSNVAKSFEELAKSKKPPFGGAEAYVRAYMTLTSERGCKMEFPSSTLYTSTSDVPSAGTSSTVYAVPVFVPNDAGDGYVMRYIQGVGLKSSEDRLAYVATTSGDYTAYQRKSCGEIVNIARNNAAAYLSWLEKHPDEAPIDRGNDNDTTTEDGTTCKIDGVGWILCPVVLAISKFNDSLFALLEGLLGVNPSMFDTSGSSAATYNTWQAVRNLANVAFVIAFMVIIYSQLTGMGLSNYGIKKMLPRIAVAAILVNISFWICAVAVDLSNIAGSSLHDLLIDQVNTMGGGVGGNLGTWDKVTAWLLAGGVGALAIGGATLVVGSYTFMGALALLIPLAVIALVAVLTVVLVLVARQAFIIILVVLSPLAFVAYLLPNTEQWFDRWRKTLFTLLLIYPLMALLFGGSQVAAAIIRNGADDALVFLLSLVVLVVPLFAVPFLLKFSGGILGKIGAVVNNPNRGPFDRMKKGSARYAERRKGNAMGRNVGRTNALREGSGRVLGDTGSRRRKAATWLSGVGNTNVKDANQKDEYAKASSEAALRNYVANRAAPPVGASPEQTAAAAAYATSLAGGNAKMASLVQSYAQQAKEEERRKDVAAEVQNMEHAYSNEQIRHMANHGTYAGSQRPDGSFEHGDALSEDAKNAAMQLHLSRTNSHGIQDTLDSLGTKTKAIQTAEAAKAAGQQLSADQEAALAQKHEIAQLQKTAVETLEKTSRAPVTLSGSMRSEMKEGTMARSQEDRFIYSVNAGKISAEKVAKMDVDEMQRMADDIGRVLADPQRASEVDRTALDTVVSEITKARSDPILGAKFGAQENKQLDRLVRL